MYLYLTKDSNLLQKHKRFLLLFKIPVIAQNSLLNLDYLLIDKPK